MSEPILIIGGGIGGLALAACLHHRGIPALIFERAPELREVGAALGVWPNAARVLKHLGVFEALAKNANVARAGELRTHTGKIMKHMLVPSSEIPGIAAHRADLLNALVSAVPPEFIHLNKSCIALQKEGDHIRASFADNTYSPWAKALVGADGINSVVRKLTLHDGPPVYRGYIAWRGVAHFPGDHPIGESWGRGQRFGLVPLGKNRVGWWATANKPEAVATQGSQDQWKAEILERYQHWHAPIPELIRATDPFAILCNPIADRPPAATWGDATTTLLGDAAHPTTPNLGQGACMAIEDAAILAYALASIHDIATALRVYEATRIRRTAFIVAESRKFGRLGQWQNPLACLLRNTLTRVAPARRMRKQFDDLWSFDAWNAPLVMPANLAPASVAVA